MSVSARQVVTPASLNQGDADQIKSARKYLVAELKRRLLVRNVQDIAEALGVTRFALESLSRPNRPMQLDLLAAIRSRFPDLLVEDDATDMVRQVGNTPNAEPSFPPGGPEAWYQSVREHQARADFERQVTSLFEYLGEGDVYVLFTYDQPPVEIENSEIFAQSVRAAVRRGARLIYVLPTLAEEAYPLHYLQSSPEELHRKIASWFREDEAFEKQVNIVTLEAAQARYLIPGLKFAFVLSNSIPVRSRCRATLSAAVDNKESAHVPLSMGVADLACAFFESLKDTCPSLHEAHASIQTTASVP